MGIYIDAYTDAEDSFCVFDLVNDWLVDLHVNEGLSMPVIPLPKERAAQMVRNSIALFGKEVIPAFR